MSCPVFCTHNHPHAFVCIPHPQICLASHPSTPISTSRIRRRLPFALVLLFTGTSWFKYTFLNTLGQANSHPSPTFPLRHPGLCPPTPAHMWFAGSRCLATTYQYRVITPASFNTCPRPPLGSPSASVHNTPGFSFFSFFILLSDCLLSFSSTIFLFMQFNIFANH